MLYLIHILGINNIQFHQVSWEACCHPKKERDLGFGNLVSNSLWILFCPLKQNSLIPHENRDFVRAYQFAVWIISGSWMHFGMLEQSIVDIGYGNRQRRQSASLMLWWVAPVEEDEAHSRHRKLEAVAMAAATQNCSGRHSWRRRRNEDNDKAHWTIKCYACYYSYHCYCKFSGNKKAILEPRLEDH